MAGNNFDLNPVFDLPTDLSPEELRNLGESMRLNLVQFLDAEIRQLNALGIEQSPSGQRRELFALREGMALIRLQPHLDEGGKGRIAVSSTDAVPNQEWLEDRLQIGLQQALLDLKKPQKLVPTSESLSSGQQYAVPTPAAGGNNWWKWLAILPTGISVAILVVLLNWISDLRGQYEALTESFLLQKEQVVQAVEEGLEKGVEAGKIYDRLKEWVLDEGQKDLPEEKDEEVQIENKESE